MSKEFDFDLPESLDKALYEMSQEQATESAVRSLAYMTAFFYNELVHHGVPQIEASRMARAFIKAVMRVND